ncbi:MAG: YjbQ family protein [Magnetospirillum sp.]|nr:YjbQ family protein [Magnetospirillum sp.]
MIQRHTAVTVATPGPGLTDVSAEIAAFVRQAGIRIGLLTVFIQHTSASLVIQENADPDVQADLDAFFRRLVREESSLYRHRAEGPDDMPAHIRAALTQTQLSIPVIDGRAALGTWQGVYVFEHRAHPHRRRLVLHAMGEP